MGSKRRCSPGGMADSRTTGPGTTTGSKGYDAPDAAVSEALARRRLEHTLSSSAPSRGPWSRCPHLMSGAGEVPSSLPSLFIQQRCRPPSTPVVHPPVHPAIRSPQRCVVTVCVSLSGP